MIFDNEGLVVQSDSNGYLVDPQGWDRAVAEQLAATEQVALGEEH